MMSGNPTSNASWASLDAANIELANRFLVSKLSSLSNRGDLATPMEMETDVASSQCYAPTQPRTILKKQSRYPRDIHRRVSFYGSVDVRVSLAEAPPQTTLWYTADEIRSMKSTALNRRSPLRHSDLMNATKTIQLSQHLLSSPPPPLRMDGANDNAQAAMHPFPQPGDSTFMARVHSAQAELNAEPAARRADPRDIRYQTLVGEVDKEVFISNDDRRRSTRRRLYHYCKVLDEIDRQVEVGYMQINVQELAEVSKTASGNAMAQAMERGRKEVTVAQAISLVGLRRL